MPVTFFQNNASLYGHKVSVAFTQRALEAWFYKPSVLQANFFKVEAGVHLPVANVQKVELPQALQSVICGVQNPSVPNLYPSKIQEISTFGLHLTLADGSNNSVSTVGQLVVNAAPQGPSDTVVWSVLPILQHSVGWIAVLHLLFSQIYPASLQVDCVESN